MPSHVYKRRVGLDRRQPVEPLLKKIPGKPGPQVADDDPPLSSSDEGEGQEGKFQRPQLDGSDSEDGQPGRGDIKPTVFRKGKDRVLLSTPVNLSSRRREDRGAEGSALTNSPFKSRGTSKRQVQGDEVEDVSDEATRAAITSGTPDGRDLCATLGEHVNTDPFLREQRTATTPYAQNSTALKFVKPKKYGGGSRVQRERKVFKQVRAITELSPRESPKKRFHSTMKSSPANTPSPSKAFQMPKIEASPSDASPPKKKRQAKGLRRSSQRKEGPTLEESQRPVFIDPDTGSFGLNLLSSPRGDFSEPIERSAAVDTADPASPDLGCGGLDNLDASSPVCPLCNEPVDRNLLNDFSKEPRMTVRQQAQFCHLHRKRSAGETWLERGYPDINWHNLDTRIAKHHAFLEEVLRGGRSHFADKFAKKVNSGKGRTIFKSEDNLTPGYYGNRGLRTMSENIVNQFSSLLRKRAIQDRLISVRGYTAFVQAVLVPELAVRLIMEDMGVVEDEGRSILSESVWIGELVNEDVGDVYGNDEEGDDFEEEASQSS